MATVNPKLSDLQPTKVAYCAGDSGWQKSEAGAGVLVLDVLGEPGEQVVGYV